MQYVNLYNKNDINYNKRESGLTFSLIAVCYTLSIILFSIIFSLFIKKESTISSIISSLVLYSTLGLLVIYILKTKKTKINCFVKKPNTKYLLISIIAIISIYLVFGTLNVHFTQFLIDVGVKIKLPNHTVNNVSEYILLLITLCVLPAIIEEFLFRGIILSGLNGVNIFVKSAICSVLFALSHANLSQLLYQFICGYLFCLIGLPFGNLVYGIIIHFINNAFVLTMEFFKVDLSILSSWWIILIGAIAFVLIMVYLIFIEKNKGNKVNSDNKNISTVFKSAVFGISFYLFIIVLSATGVM
jgi:membrane protease YdiL (CAAX protease family)